MYGGVYGGVYGDVYGDVYGVVGCVGRRVIHYLGGLHVKRYFMH